MQVKIKKLEPDVKLPSFAHPGDAGMDVFSRENITLQPNQRHAFKTGFAMEFPEDYVALCLDKSGLAKNHGLHCMAGVMDSGYRGEIQVVLINLSAEQYKINKGDKIAQIVFTSIPLAEVQEVEELSDTNRGEGGFGSTGR